MDKNKLDENIFTFELDPESLLTYKILEFAQTFSTKNILMLDELGDSDSEDEDYEENLKNENLTSTALIPLGITEIKYQGNDSQKHDIVFDYKKIPNVIVMSYEKIVFSKTLYISSTSGKDLLMEFCKEALIYSRNKIKKDCIPCYILSDEYWCKRKDISKRCLDTIYLEDDIINDILKDIDGFINNKNRYKNLGIPYKRNYLFTGVPGTGKTSLVRALASKYNKGIAYLSFSAELTDSKFSNAISRLPKNCFLLLEDFDSLFVKRDNADSECNVSFSSILNALDGILTNDKQITFITTNYMDQLDKALKRASRIDYILKFTHLNEEQVRKMFTKYFPEDNRCDEFVKLIKSNLKKLTPSMLQHYFNKYYECDVFKKLNKLNDIIIEFDVMTNTSDTMYS